MTIAQPFSMKMSYLFVSLCLLASFHQSGAQAQLKGGSISDVKFISGSWKASTADRSIDAVWSPAAGENIVGYVRVMKEGKVVLYEMFAFEQSQDGLIALVRHFGPGLVAREEKETPNLYTFMEAGPKYAMFQKQGEDTRVRYEKRSENEFAIVVGKPQDGQWAFKDFWVFTRVK